MSHMRAIGGQVRYLRLGNRRCYLPLYTKAMISEVNLGPANKCDDYIRMLKIGQHFAPKELHQMVHGTNRAHAPRPILITRRLGTVFCTFHFTLQLGGCICISDGSEPGEGESSMFQRSSRDISSKPLASGHCQPDLTLLRVRLGAIGHTKRHSHLF
jgi:hypothetical protein